MEGIEPRTPAQPRSPALLGMLLGMLRGDAPLRPHKEQEMAAASALPRLSAGPSARLGGGGSPGPAAGRGWSGARLLPRSGGCAPGPGCERGCERGCDLLLGAAAFPPLGEEKAASTPGE